jgi:hypothetical protein
MIHIVLERSSALELYEALKVYNEIRPSEEVEALKRFIAEKLCIEV